MGLTGCGNGLKFCECHGNLNFYGEPMSLNSWMPSLLNSHTMPKNLPLLTEKQPIVYDKMAVKLGNNQKVVDS